MRQPFLAASAASSSRQFLERRSDMNAGRRLRLPLGYVWHRVGKDLAATIKA